MDSRHNVLITGGSGLIGSHLTHMFLEKGHAVTHVSRVAHQGKVRTFTWDIKKRTIDAKALQNIDTIIHLAGASVGDKRWTPSRKKEILASRTESTRLLYTALKEHQHEVKNFISASAIGYYGFGDDQKIFTETDNPGGDFLAQVVKQWEAEADAIQELNIRLVKLRIGIVLAQEGGALQEMAKPVKWFAGAPLGSGKQLISWIHIDDLCGIFLKAVEHNDMEGVYNAVASTVSNETLTKRIASMLNKPLLLPAAPAFVLKLMLGEMADVVLNGSAVSNKKILQAGYRFKYSDLDGALHDLLR